MSATSTVINNFLLRIVLTTKGIINSAYSISLTALLFISTTTVQNTIFTTISGALVVIHLPVRTTRTSFKKRGAILAKLLLP